MTTLKACSDNRKGGFMCAYSRPAAAALLLFLTLPLCSGCTIEEAEQNLQTGRDATLTLTPAVPIQFKWIPAAITGLTTVALGVLAAIKERRRGNKMKKAILTKAKQIDKLITANNPITPKTKNTITTFMKKHTADANPETTTDLHYFDAVRKEFVS